MSIHGTAYDGLKDGGLSVKIDGVEHVSDVHGLHTETTCNGDGAGSFWVEPDDPFTPIAAEYHPGATVDVTHTLSGVVKQLYRGFIISDPKTGFAGETKRLDVECGGVLEMAKWRQDTGFVIADPDLDQWFENKKNAKWASIDISDALEIRAGEGIHVPRGPDDTPRAAIVGYLAYEGATYLTKGEGGPLNGIKRLECKVTTKLGDGMRAKLGWSSTYKVSRDPADYTTIKLWDSEADRHLGNLEGGVDFGDSFGGTDGAGYVVLCLWTTEPKGIDVTKHDQYIRLDDVVVYTNSDATPNKRVDEAMLMVADFIGAHDAATTSAIGSLLSGIVARPPTDPISSMNVFAQQADVLVKWGWWSYYSAGSKYEFVCQPWLTNPTTIRAMTNCYAIDADEPGAEWDVRQHPEDGGNWRGLRLTYGRRGRSDYPAGFPDTVAAPGGCNSWGTSIPFHGATARILAVDFSGHNYSNVIAKRLAKRLWRSLGAGQSSGSCTLRLQEVHRWSSPSTWRPAPYIRGGDYVECHQSSCGPLPVMRSHIDYDLETVTLEVGMEEEALLEQLEAAGALPRSWRKKERPHFLRRPRRK